MGKKRFSVVCFVLLFSFLIFFLGCASTSYVNKRFSEMEGRLDGAEQEIDRLSRKAVSTDSKAEEAYQKATDAMAAAEEAARGARGLGEYEVTGEERINFEFNSYELTSIATNVLDEVGKRMQEDRHLVLEIMGHTDAVGSDKYNLLLGHDRSESAMRYLQEKYSIPLYRMYILSYGETKPESENDSPKGQAANRRVLLRLLGP
jgi:outer membrane protein OmpA-like peptidoglycan-associated protein